MANTTSPTVGDRLRGALATARIKQVDAAAVLGISQPALSRRLAGEVEISREEIEKLAALCNVPVSTLLTEAAA